MYELWYIRTTKRGVMREHERGNTMATITFYARVKLPNNSTQVITVQASTYSNARAMIEAQYGKGSIVGGPTTNKM